MGEKTGSHKRRPILVAILESHILDKSERKSTTMNILLNRSYWMLLDLEQ